MFCDFTTSYSQEIFADSVSYIKNVFLFDKNKLLFEKEFNFFKFMSLYKISNKYIRT